MDMESNVFPEDARCRTTICFWFAIKTLTTTLVDHGNDTPTDSITSSVVLGTIATAEVRNLQNCD